MRRVIGIVGVILTATLAGAFAPAAQPAAKGDGEVIVTDVEGVEHKLTAAKLAAGTRRLGWLADPKGTTVDAKQGPLALEIRETNSTTYAKGVITLVPMTHIELAKYDYGKQSASFTVKGLKEPLVGTLEYKGMNVLGVSGTADGKAASFTGGVLGKGAVKTITFPAVTPLPPAPKEPGKSWAVKIVPPKKGTGSVVEFPPLVVRNLKALYQFPGGTEQLVDGVPLRKGTPIPFDDKLKRFELLANDENTNIAVAEIEVVGGPEKTVAIPLTMEVDKKTGHLAGFLGEVDAGWKLFPLHTVRTIVPHEKKVD